MQTSHINKYLNFIPYTLFELWDTKRYTSKSIASSFDIVSLGSCIKEENKKYKLFLFEDEYFGILGVNNKDGVFDAYTQKGKEINQPYKKMKVGWLAYNPYRINVGSIGIRKEEHKNDYISPAYVVFSCNEKLLPEFLFLIFKTETFSKIINESTTGSVRQNLTMDILKSLQIPLPSINEQQNLVQNYYAKIKKAENLNTEANSVECKLEIYLNEVIGYKIKNTQSSNVNHYFRIIDSSSLEKWGVDKNNQTTLVYSKLYETKKIKELCSVSSGGTPSRSIKEYYNGNIPWIKTGEVLNNVIYDTEEKITQEAVENSSAKIYPKDSLIIAMYGQGLTRGRTAKLGIDASTNQACAVLFNINNDLILTDFLWIYLMGEYHRLRDLASGNNQPNLNAQMIKDYNVVIPPFEIQEQIIECFKSQKEKIVQLQFQAKKLKNQAEEEFEKGVFKL